jgi:membrane-bound metal-dependent hydrolase YbcI (DUF457 family)
MNFTSHAKAGFWTALIAAVTSFLIKNDLRFSLLAGALCWVGAVLPDLDTDSIPSRWAARLGLAFTCLCIYTGSLFPATIAGLLFFAVKSTVHRGITHSYFLPLLCIALGIWHGNFLYGSFGIGLLCHLVVDQLSPLDSRNWL